MPNEWKKTGGQRDGYLRFEVGKIWEGVYQGFKERSNPFWDSTNEKSPQTIVDYAIEINKENKILSSTAQTLRDQLMPLVVGTLIKIECIQKGIKKWYQVWTKS